MSRALSSLVLVVSCLIPSLAPAARVERLPESIQGQARFLYDSTTKEFGIEMENKDAVKVNRDYINFNVSSGSTGVVEHFSEGAVDKGLVVLNITGVAQTAAAQQLDIGYTGNGNRFIFGQSTAQTILPVMAATGLDIGGDQVSGEAYEMWGGYLGASGRPFVVGTDPPFYFCLTAIIADASGASDFHVGFRRPQAQTATLGTYTDFATIGLEGTSNPNTIQVMTSDDDSETTTDTTDTWADAAQKKLCVYVGAAGAATYTINDVAPTVTAAATIDDGEMMIPFVHFQHSADVAGTVIISEWDVGLQELD